jgi:hypothetical protein
MCPQYILGQGSYCEECEELDCDWLNPKWIAVRFAYSTAALIDEKVARRKSS